MGVWAWLILLAWSAAIATTVQPAFFRHDRKPNWFTASTFAVVTWPK
jgi:hypothetical protein